MSAECGAAWPRRCLFGIPGDRNAPSRPDVESTLTATKTPTRSPLSDSNVLVRLSGGVDLELDCLAGAGSQLRCR